MIKEFMKNQDDLDVFSAAQMPISEILEKGGKSKRVNLVMVAAALQTKIDSRITEHLSPEEWQRAAYEAFQIHKADPSGANAMIASALWRLVQYQQECVILIEKVSKDPVVLARMKELGLPTSFPGQE